MEDNYDCTQDDAICCALTANRTVEVIYRVLQQYIPGYEQLPGDYGVLSLPDELTFPDEDALLHFCVADYALSGSFFWNKWHGNPHRIMVGAVLTNDGQLVMSLTMPATQTGRVEEIYLSELQLLIGSDCGVIYGNEYPPYKNGADFRLRYTNK